MCDDSTPATTESTSEYSDFGPHAQSQGTGNAAIRHIDEFFDEPLDESYRVAMRIASWSYNRARAAVIEAQRTQEIQLASPIIQARQRGADFSTIRKMLFWIVMNHPEFHLRNLAELIPEKSLDEIDDLQKELRELGDRKFRELEILDLKTMPYKEYLQSDHWQQIREYALEDAGRRCQLCNAEHNLHVHHRTYERRGEEAPGDLTVLCAECHQHFHNGRKVGK